ncbi:MAG TPA: hypothetical protein VK115_01665 [Staphylococcus sp.]|nr:hypothetical protein [Staphylococcus sp.]
MSDVYVFIIACSDGSVYREYVENVWKIDKTLALKRFEKGIKRYNYFYLKDCDKYINVSKITSIKIEGANI